MHLSFWPVFWQSLTMLALMIGPLAIAFAVSYVVENHTNNYFLSVAVLLISLALMDSLSIAATATFMTN